MSLRFCLYGNSSTDVAHWNKCSDICDVHSSSPLWQTVTPAEPGVLLKKLRLKPRKARDVDTESPRLLGRGPTATKTAIRNSIAGNSEPASGLP